ncbi:hypothetical protein Tco_0876448 [Tanacetum coccineum]|uniref:Uncharacterized protein n=1 Tax=Tanacetum coccineum TaxID=301880 RepID=A0ABQ5BVA1_9ASTR
MNVFVRISFGSTIKLVSFDESQVVTFNGKFICGFRNSDCGTGSQSDNTVDSHIDRQFLGVEVGCFFDRMELFCFVDEVFDLEYVQVQPDGKCGAQNTLYDVLKELMYYFDQAFNSFDFEEKCIAHEVPLLCIQSLEFLQQPFSLKPSDQVLELKSISFNSCLNEVYSSDKGRTYLQIQSSGTHLPFNFFFFPLSFGDQSFGKEGFNVNND